MKDYKLTIEDGVITWIENTDESGNPTSVRLFIPKESKVSNYCKKYGIQEVK